MYKDSCCFKGQTSSGSSMSPDLVSPLLLPLPPFFQAFFPFPQLPSFSDLSHYLHHQSLGLLPSTRIEKGEGSGRICSKMPTYSPCPVWLDCCCFLPSERVYVHETSDFWFCFLWEVRKMSVPSLGCVCWWGAVFKRGLKVEWVSLGWRALSSWIS